jgi:putative transposase
VSRIYFIIKNELTRIRKNMMQNAEEITSKIRQIVEQYPYFGYRRIHAILKHRYGFGTHRNKVYRIMKEQQLCLPVITSKKQLFKGIPISLNVSTEASNTLWGIDMTYIWCGRDGWGYFHGVIDHYDKTMLGYHFLAEAVKRSEALWLWTKRRQVAT